MKKDSEDEGQSYEIVRFDSIKFLIVANFVYDCDAIENVCREKRG